MKRLISFVSLISILFLMFSVPAIGQLARRDSGRLSERKAQAERAMQDVSTLSPEQASVYEARIKAHRQAFKEQYLQSQKSGSAPTAMARTADAEQLPPAVLFASYANTYVGMSTYGFNAVDFPDGTVMGAGKIVDGNFTPMTWTQFGDMPAGLFRYPMDEGLRGTFMERYSVIYYEAYVFLPNGQLSVSYRVKQRNKLLGMPAPEKLFTSGVARPIADRAIAFMRGPIVEITGKHSVMVLDADADYSQRSVPYRIVPGGIMRVDLYDPWLGIPPNHTELIILVGTPDGRTDQYTVVVEYDY